MDSESKISGNIFDIVLLKKIYAFAKPFRAVLYLIIFLTICTALAAIAKPILTQITIDRYVATKDSSGLLMMTIWLTVLLWVHGLLQYTLTYLSGWLGQNIVKNMRVKLYGHLLSFRLSYFDKTPIGRLVTRTVSDVESLSNVFSEGLAGIISDLLLILAILFIMFYTHWKLTLFALGALPLLILSTYIFKEKVKSSFNQVRTAIANLNTFVQEHITGISVVQTFNSEAREYQKFTAINQKHRDANLRSVLYYSVYFPVAEFISALSIALLLWYGAYDSLRGYTSLGTLTSFIMYISMFFRPIRMIADRFNTIQMAVVSSDRIFRVLDNREDISPTGNFTKENILGKIEFKDVWFAYNENNFVLKGISFEVNPGETVAFVGTTGAGKSSVINILNRFYEIQSGTIKIDDVDIREYDLRFLRSHIGMVMQDVFLFSDSIRNNISLYNPHITDDLIWQAIHKVGADKFIKRLPGELHYNVMERGATLSVGQRQMISFIRTLVYNPSILILDEATASIDSESEEMIQQAVQTLMKDRTSIIIAHRLSTVQHANKIIVLDGGEIKESGTHEELLAKGGYYARLILMQQKLAV
ncbi:MAG: ABC transporter ATP-binding protein/permease [Cytophagaceae bacterium]|nr:ABC transporter ATP-binding protein/permease [Cytophagaceae bacterium]MDW8456912.1 ABC transporter ATP-binding protein [Cytophagaceae bacterium]